MAFYEKYILGDPSKDTIRREIGGVAVFPLLGFENDFVEPVDTGVELGNDIFPTEFAKKIAETFPDETKEAMEVLNVR